MTLYNQRSKNIFRTWLLMIVFLGLIMGIGWIFSQVYNSPGIFYFAIIISLIINIFSYWFSDKVALALHRAKPVDPKTDTELYRVLENLSITAGLPMPKFYVIEDPALNAFATGRNPKHAVVVVTTGLLEKLERSELEGVLAHELSHIGNRDILISTIAVVLAGMVAILSDMFSRSLWYSGDSDNKRSSGILILIALGISLLAPIFATLLRLAISRKREFLADASGALLTRYPEGLASALRKISAGPALHSATNATAHLFFENPFKADAGSGKTSWIVRIFSTHPPIEERIQALLGMKTQK